ncbi:MAG: cytochrome C [Desulfuromonas sp.]|nr:MAG: cytochrome C [Desulfuromonas sp.]
MAVDKAVESAKQAVSPETVVLEASYGNVTFTHGAHAESYDCTVCHGDGAPASFDLDKATAHALCKDCHKQEGAGPTSCKECHVK